MLARKWPYQGGGGGGGGGVGGQTYEGLKISVNSIIEATQFLL